MFAQLCKTFTTEHHRISKSRESDKTIHSKQQHSFDATPQCLSQFHYIIKLYLELLYHHELMCTVMHLYLAGLHKAAERKNCSALVLGVFADVFTQPKQTLNMEHAACSIQIPANDFVDSLLLGATSQCVTQSPFTYLTRKQSCQHDKSC